MALSFKHFKQILDDELAYLVGHSDLTDVNPGSVNRTLMEATSLEIAQVFVQMQAILNLFSIDKASGDDLDERAVDFNETRDAPTRSVGVVTIGDSDLTSSDTALSTSAAPLTGGASTQVQIQVADFASFPVSGSVILDRSGINRELIAYSSKTGPDLLNFVGNPVNSHPTGIIVHLSTIGADRSIVAGTVAKTADDIKYDTTAAATLFDGEFEISNVPIQSQETGAATLAGPGKINQFVSPPFPTATITNPANVFGGRDLEGDAAFRDRIKQKQQSLSSSTKLKIENEALKIEIMTTGQRVITASLIEPIAPGASTLFINDGTKTFSPTSVAVNATEVLLSVSETGQRRAIFANWPLVPGSERIFVSLDRGTTTSVGLNSLTDTTQVWTVNQYAGFKVKDVNDVFYDIVSNTSDTLTLSNGLTPSSGVYAIFDPSATTFLSGGSLLVKDTDYVINDSNGQFELSLSSFPAGLVSGDSLIAFYNGVLSAYTYFDGLLQKVQRTINGDATDIETFPGVKATGTRVDVISPTIISPSLVLLVSSQPGVAEVDLHADVVSEVVNYVNGLTIGDDVLISRVIDAALNVVGILDVSVVTPISNVIVSEAQLAKIDSSDVAVS